MFFKDCWIKVDADRLADLGVSTEKKEILQHSYASTIKILQHSYASTTGIALLPFCKRIHVQAKIVM